jgi:hypothetical protein
MYRKKCIVHVHKTVTGHYVSLSCGIEMGTISYSTSYISEFYAKNVIPYFDNEIKMNEIKV